MGPREPRWWLVLGFLAVGTTAWAGPSLDAAEAAALLSRYPAGSLPVEASTMTAIQVLGQDGTREDISLLRNVAEHERDEVRSLALESIATIRDRQRLAQRETYARSAPEHTALTSRAAALRAGGFGTGEAACAAYADMVLGDEPFALPSTVRVPAKGDPETLLAEGRARLAVSVLALDRSPEARRLEAVAWEDLGDPRGAIRQYALLAASGEAEAWGALDGYGVHAERLMLGMYTRAEAWLSPGEESELLEVLVRRGDALTVEVLAERATRPSASERAIAADAVARMLQGDGRDDVLTETGRTSARAALVRASRDRVESIRAIALEAL